MNLVRRALLAAPLAAPALAQGAPIRLVVGFPPGGSTDLVARMLAPAVQAAYGVPVVVENRPGASGNIGAQAVARAPGDGLSWLVVFDTHAVNPFLINPLGFDMQRDLAPVCLVGTAPNLVMAQKDKPYRDIAAFLTAARARPDALTYGTIGNGSLAHLAMSLAQKNGNMRLVHVPYRGGGPLVTATTAGETDVAVATFTVFAGQLGSGLVKPLAALGTARLPNLPDVPTLAEAGIQGVNAPAFWGVLAPGTTPAPLRARMEGVLRDALATPELRGRLTEQLGVQVAAGGGEQFGQFLAQQMEQWGAVVRENNIRPD